MEPLRRDEISVTVGYRVPLSLYRKIERLAHKRQTTKSAILREATRKGLNGGADDGK